MYRKHFEAKIEFRNWRQI